MDQKKLKIYSTGCSQVVACYTSLLTRRTKNPASKILTSSSHNSTVLGSSSDVHAKRLHSYVEKLQVSLEKKLSSALEHVCSALLLTEALYSYIHSCNPNLRQLHLSILGVTCLHPGMQISTAYIQADTFQLCSLLVSSWPPIQFKSSSTYINGYPTSVSVKVFLV